MKCKQCILIIISCLLLVACSKSSQDASFIEKMDIVDGCIASKQYTQAFSLLKKASKNAYSSFYRLSIARRALQLGQIDYAEEWLAESLEKHPNNPEIRGVYAHLLISKKEYKKAETISLPLLGTPYGSIYSEALLRQGTSDTNWLSSDFIQPYLDLAKTTGNPGFSKNAAIIYALTGNFDSALECIPESITLYDNPYFWALLSYDARLYSDSLLYISMCELSSKVYLLASDASLASGNIPSASQYWQTLCAQYPNLSPVPYVNQGRYELLSQNIIKGRDYLEKLVLYFPTYGQGLSLFGEYALLSIEEQREDLLTQTIRSKGVKTLQMELEDTIPRIQPSYVLTLMDAALEEEKDPNLQIAQMKLIWNTKKNYSNEQKMVDMWNLLEKNEIEPFSYPLELVRYSIWLLLHNNQVDIASSFFEEHIPKESKTLWDWEAEACILIYQEKYQEAISVYEHIISEKGYAIPVTDLFNLGTLYESRGDKSKAFLLYKNIAESKVENIYLAENQYRISRIQADRGELRAANLGLEYCLSLNPNHIKARLLQKKIRTY